MSDTIFNTLNLGDNILSCVVVVVIYYMIWTSIIKIVGNVTEIIAWINFTDQVGSSNVTLEGECLKF